MQDTAMDITQVLLAAQSPDANLRTVAESNLTQFRSKSFKLRSTVCVTQISCKPCYKKRHVVICSFQINVCSNLCVLSLLIILLFCTGTTFSTWVAATIRSEAFCTSTCRWFCCDLSGKLL